MIKIAVFSANSYDRKFLTGANDSGMSCDTPPRSVTGKQCCSALFLTKGPVARAQEAPII
jgi:hypothetical protein